MKPKYVLTKQKFGDLVFFGIAAIADYENNFVIIKKYNDISSNREKTEQLVNLCNSLELSLCHFEEVVCDFVNTRWD